MSSLSVTEKISEIKPIRDIIFDHLRQEILDGKIQPDDRLIERDVAGQLGVSRTPVREALRRLESEGFVEYLPRKGVVVRGFNLTEIEEIYEIRCELECLAVRKAVENSTDDDLAMIEEFLSQLKTEGGDGDAQAAVDDLRSVDDLILRIARMPLLENFIGVLYTSLTRYKKINLSKAPRRSNAVKEHRAILQAIAARDAAEAEKLTRLHINSARQVLLRHCNFKKE